MYKKKNEIQNFKKRKNVPSLISVLDRGDFMTPIFCRCWCSSEYNNYTPMYSDSFSLHSSTHPSFSSSLYLVGMCRFFWLPLCSWAENCPNWRIRFYNSIHWTELSVQIRSDFCQCISCFSLEPCDKYNDETWRNYCDISTCLIFGGV